MSYYTPWARRLLILAGIVIVITNLIAMTINNVRRATAPSSCQAAQQVEP